MAQLIGKCTDAVNLEISQSFSAWSRSYREYEYLDQCIPLVSYSIFCPLYTMIRLLDMTQFCRWRAREMPLAYADNTVHVYSCTRDARMPILGVYTVLHGVEAVLTRGFARSRAPTGF